MKKIIYLLIILPLFIVTCRKKEEIDFSQYKASGYLLGNSWQASSANFTLNYNNTFVVNLPKYNELKELRQMIGLLNLSVFNDTIILRPLKTTTTGTPDSIIPSANFGLFLADGDLLGDSYKLLEDGTFKNWVYLKKVSKDEIAGKFQVAFVIKERLYPFNKTLPDTLYFTSGEFLSRRR